MSRAIAFDTLRYSKKLIKAGVPEPQAEVQAEAIKELIEEKLATKDDLKRLEERLTYKLIISFGGMLVTAVIVLAAIIKL